MEEVGEEEKRGKEEGEGKEIRSDEGKKRKKRRNEGVGKWTEKEGDRLNFT